MKRVVLPENVRNMSPKELVLLTYEIREFLLETVSKTGGHLAANLGAVELTVALHKVFNSPVDKLVWDIGHQSYIHKLLTGRSERFDTLRKLDGLSGFPRRDESEHDCFNTGHSSTSLSLAAGFAAARGLNKEKHHVVAVIGDGALTGGMAYEALNNLGASDSKVIIILNDNAMSISKNVGGISRNLSKLRMSRKYLGFKKQVKSKLIKLPGLYNGIEHIKDSVKYAMVDGAFFEELGFKYFGPVDGHNIENLIEIFSLAKDVEGSVVIHVLTQKGKGYKNAEKNPDMFHGIDPFDITTGIPYPKKSDASFSQTFGKKMIKLAQCDDKLVVISAAMIEGTGLKEFKAAFPERTFDVGIAEGHAVTFAAGLAASGFKPVVAIYSSFLQRAYDQVISDVCLQNLPVIFAIDRAGGVGSDGQTHQGIYDISYLSHIPNLTLLAPKDTAELEKMLDYAHKSGKPCAIRYPKEGESGQDGGEYIETAKSEVIKTGSDIEIWALGNMVKYGRQALILLEEKGYSAGLVNARFVKPLDEAALLSSINRTKIIVTLEDNIITGGFGSRAADFIESNGKTGVRLLKLGWPEQFLEHGGIEELFRKYRLDGISVAERICEFIEGTA